MTFARNTSSTSRRALVWDVHVPLLDARGMPSAFIHDGKVTNGNWSILIGAVNELPQAARKLGMALDASVFIPEEMLPANWFSMPTLKDPTALDDSTGDKWFSMLPLNLQQGLLKIRAQYSTVLVCPSALLLASTRVMAGAIHRAIPRVRYDGIVCWSGFFIRHTDSLGRYLGISPDRSYQVSK